MYLATYLHQNLPELLGNVQKMERLLQASHHWGIHRDSERSLPKHSKKSKTTVLRKQAKPSLEGQHSNVIRALTKNFIHVTWIKNKDNLSNPNHPPSYFARFLKSTGESEIHLINQPNRLLVGCPNRFQHLHHMNINMYAQEYWRHHDRKHDAERRTA